MEGQWRLRQDRQITPVPWNTVQGTLGVGCFPWAEDGAGLNTACTQPRGETRERYIASLHFVTPPTPQPTPDG